MSKYDSSMIEVEDLALGLKSSWIDLIMGTVSTFPIIKSVLSWPFVGPWLREILVDVVTFVTEKLELIPFIFNSKVMTTMQGQEFVKALRHKNSLPEDVSDKEWKEAEYAVNTTFDNLIKYAR